MTKARLGKPGLFSEAGVAASPGAEPLWGPTAEAADPMYWGALAGAYMNAFRV
jgi:hypothetical protein